MKPLLILKTGYAPAPIAAEHGDFEAWFQQYLQTDLPLLVVNAVTEEALPATDSLAGVLVTGSPAMVSHREAWSERAALWLGQVFTQGLPMLGVCYGHQLIAHALGGRVGPNAAGRHIGTARLRLTAAGEQDALLASLGAEAAVQVTHIEHVQELPDGAEVLATAALDPHHALRFGPHAWGLQFHPEFSAPVLRSYVALRWDSIAREGLQPDRIHQAVQETPAASRLLARFAAYCREWQREEKLLQVAS